MKTLASLGEALADFSTCIFTMEKSVIKKRCMPIAYIDTLKSLRTFVWSEDLQIHTAESGVSIPWIECGCLQAGLDVCILQML